MAAVQPPAPLPPRRPTSPSAVSGRVPFVRSASATSVKPRLQHHHASSSVSSAVTPSAADDTLRSLWTEDPDAANAVSEAGLDDGDPAAEANGVRRSQGGAGGPAPPQRQIGDVSASAVPASTAPLQPRRPPLTLAASSSSLRSLRTEPAPRTTSPLPPPSDATPSLHHFHHHPEAVAPMPTTQPIPHTRPGAPETANGPSASAEGLLAFVLSMRRTGPPRPAAMVRTASESSAALLASHRLGSHSRNQSTGSTDSVDEELEPRTAEMARTPSSSSLTGASKNRTKALTGLESVDLSHKKISDLPASVVSVLAGSVERLALGYNHLQALPLELAQLGSTLRYLNIRVNSFTVFPAVLCEIPSLEILDISRNKISKMPRAAGSLRSLKVLSLSKNRLNRLPSWFSQLTALRVLKLDHNPIVFPPREIIAFPVAETPPHAPQDQADADRQRMRHDDLIMANWIASMQAYISDHSVERKGPPHPLTVDGDPLSESEGWVAQTVRPLNTSQRGAMGPPPVPLPAVPSPPPGAETPRAPRPRPVMPPASTSPTSTITTVSTGSSSRSVSSTSPSTPLSFLDGDSKPPLPTHSRNASTSTADGSFAPHPGLKSKKSLPDLRQSHAQIIDERIAARGPETEAFRLANSTALRRPRADSMASPAIAAFPLSNHRPPLSASSSYFDVRRPQPEPPLPSVNLKNMSPQSTKLVELDRPRRTTEADFVTTAAQIRAEVSGKISPAADDPRSVGVDRNSGAYFRRLSMLPPSTISKAVPLVLLHFVDAIRGILFALSQMHSALKQFVVFATPDRLPGALARMLANAETSMGGLINALDRFDSSTRRSTPTSDVVRELFEACRENVAVFGKLIGVLALQLKILTATADVRYIRTLMLMLFGSMGEVATAWENITPLAGDLRILLKGSAEKSAAVTLQPPTPSPETETAALPPTRPTPPPMPSVPPLSKTRSRGASTSNARRHGGSFSGDVASLPKNGATDILPKLNLTSVSLNTSVASMKPRPGAPKLSMPIEPPLPSLGMLTTAGAPLPAYRDIFEHLSEMPPTPIVQIPPSAHEGVEDASRTATPLTAQVFQTPGPKSAAPAPTAGDGGIIEDFLDMVDGTTNVALSVCAMLTERTTVRRFSELHELCENGAEMARHLKADLARLPGGQAAMSDSSGSEGSAKWRAAGRALTAADCKRLWEDSNAFAKAVIQIASLARAVAQEASKTTKEQPFAEAAREGISHLAKATNTLLSIASVAVKPR